MRVLAIAAACALALGCPPLEPRPEILEPLDHSSVEPVGGTPLEVDFGTALPLAARVTVRLLTGIDPPPGGGAASPHIVEVFDVPVGGSDGLSAFVDAELLEPGRNTLFVNVDLDADGTSDLVASSTFSWEPDLFDPDAPAVCDPLDPEECLFPFPNDHFTLPDPETDTGRRVALTPSAMPDTPLGPIDPTEWNRSDGFSPGPMLLAYFPDLDLDASGAPPIRDLRRSLEPDSAVVLVRAATGERELVWAELDAPENGVPPDARRALILRPGRNLESGERYLVALRGLRDSAGGPVPASRGFQVYRDAIPTFAPALEARRPAMEALFADLEAAGVAREELVLAWDFTVASQRNLAERLLHMRDDAFGALAGQAPAFTVTETEDRDAGDTRIFRRVRGTYDVPLYLTDGGVPGSRLVLDAAGLPVRQPGTFAASFRCVIPRDAAAGDGRAALGSRPSLYGHGLLGSNGEVNASHVAAMAFEHGFVFCGTDMIGMASDDIDGGNIFQIINDLSNFPSLSDRMHQGILNSLFLGRLLRHPDGFASDPAFLAGDPAEPVLDAAPVSWDGNPKGIIEGGATVFYDGNSQGAISGGAVTAFAQDWTRAVLGVPGMNYSTLLRRSVDFDPFATFLKAGYAENLERSLAIALIQMPWDRVETSGHANHLTRDPHPDTPVHQILLHVAFGDFQVANVSAEVEARSLGASIHQPALAPGKHWEADPYVGLPPIAYPHPGSALVYWDSGNPTPPDENVPPRATGDPGLSACALRFGEDPHECPRRQPSARLQKSEFLSEDGVVIDVCGAAPCLAPDP